MFDAEGRIFRCVYPHAAGDLRSFLSSSPAAAWLAEGSLAATTVLQEPPDAQLPADVHEKLREGAILVEHRPIPFANYPYEWPPEMLRAAAALTLRLARAALDGGFAIKDATPYNIMFEGAKPVFLDVLSFERRGPLETVWRPYAQFVRTFIYPLLANRHFGVRVDELLLVHRDGLEPERIARLCSPVRLLLPPFVGAVALPALLSRWSERRPAEEFGPRKARSQGEARFILGRLFSRADRLLRATRAPARRTASVEYMDSGHTYGAAELRLKENVVSSALGRGGARSVLDIGCNTGHFSMLAAGTGARVVAVDRDPDAVDAVWRAAAGRGLDVLPLVIDIARPTGAWGWANAEHPPFLDRARGRFDCVLMLALIHHLIVNERIPLDRLFELAAELSARLLVVEYVDPADTQFQRIARGRGALHRDLTRETFEAAAGRWFETIEARDATPTRRIYILEKRRR